MDSVWYENQHNPLVLQEMGQYGLIMYLISFLKWTWLQCARTAQSQLLLLRAVGTEGEGGDHHTSSIWAILTGGDYAHHITTGGPQIVRILGPQGIVLLQKLYKVGTDLVLKLQFMTFGFSKSPFLHDLSIEYK